MLQLNCGGKLLDIGTDVQLSLTKSNNAFTFGELELTRSVSFKLPATDNNNKVLSLANDIHYMPEQSYKKIATQLQYDGGTADGLLYVSQCGKGSYECVFVFGSLFALKNLSDNGFIADHYQYTQEDTEGVAMNSPKDANASGLKTFDLVKYYHEVGANDYLNPSIRLQDLIKDIATEFSPLSFTSVMGADKVRIILDKLNDVNNINIGITNTTFVANNLVYWRSTFTGDDDTNVFKHTLSYIAQTWSDTPVHTTTTTTYYVMPITLNAYKEVELTFPANFPDGVFLCSFDASGNISFFGKYAFDVEQKLGDTQPSERAITGTPLKNRTITLKKYDRTTGALNNYRFIKRDHYYNQLNPRREGFLPQYAEYNDAEILGKIVAKPVYNSSNKVYLKDNIPSDLKYLDVIKVLSVVMGKWIKYNETTHVISLEDYNILSWDRVELKDVVKVEALQRTFKNWSKKNNVVCDSEEYITTPLKVTYNVNNDSLEEEKEVYKLPYSEGLKYWDGSTYPVAEVEDFEKDGTTYKTSAKKKSIAIEGLGSEYMGYIKQVNSYLNNVHAITNMCGFKTKIKVTAVMSLLEYNAIKDNMTILYNGVVWVWLEAQWSKGKAVLTLQKYA